jgi:hypothetical protein
MAHEVVVLRCKSYHCKHRKIKTSDDMNLENDSHADFYITTPEKEVQVIPKRETHPFETEVPMVGGVRGRGKGRRGQGRKNRPPPRNRQRKNNNSMVVYKREKQPAVVLGNSRRVTLVYEDGSDTRAFVGQNYGVWAIKANDVYDPDPLLGTGGITGYAELVAFFSLWLVDQVDLDLCFVSNEPAIALKLAIVLSPLALTGSISSRTLALDAIERPNCVWKSEIGETTGMSRVKVPPISFRPNAIVGDKRYYNAGTYNGGTSSSPSSLVYINFILVAASAVATIANGVYYEGTFSYTVKFFRLQSTLLGSVALGYFHQIWNERTQHYQRGEDVSKYDLLLKRLFEGESICLPSIFDSPPIDDIVIKQPETEVVSRLAMLEKKFANFNV